MSVSSPTRKCEASRANESSARGLALIISARPPETSPRLVSNLSTGGETCVLERHWWEPACIKFCNHMFKNSRKRYRDRGKDTRIQPALKQIRLWHLIPYTLRKKKKTHLLKYSFVHTGLAPKYHLGPISDQVYHQISFLRFCYGFSWSCEPWYQKFPNPEI